MVLQAGFLKYSLVVANVARYLKSTIKIYKLIQMLNKLKV